MILLLCQIILLCKTYLDDKVLLIIIIKLSIEIVHQSAYLPILLEKRRIIERILIIFISILLIYDLWCHKKYIGILFRLKRVFSAIKTWISLFSGPNVFFCATAGNLLTPSNQCWTNIQMNSPLPFKLILFSISSTKIMNTYITKASMKYQRFSIIIDSK